MTTLHVPDDLAAQLAAEAARRGIGVDELSAELLRAGLGGGDALEAFIGSGRSGQARTRRPRSLAAGNSGRSDISERVDELLADGFGR